MRLIFVHTYVVWKINTYLLTYLLNIGRYGQLNIGRYGQLNAGLIKHSLATMSLLISCTT